MSSLRPSLITPTAAEAIVDHIRHSYGLGDAYHLRIEENEDGTWRVADGLGHALRVPAMGERAFRKWFDATYGDVIADRLETSEA